MWRSSILSFVLMVDFIRVWSLTAIDSSSIHTISVERIFASLLADPSFRHDYWKKCATVVKPFDGIEGHFNMEDIEQCFAEQFIIAGRGTSGGKGGWNIAQIGSEPRGSSFEEAKLKFNELEESLRKTDGAVVINSAGSYIPSLAKVCEECLNVFGLPVNMNLYITAAGKMTSAPPHTDKQDVFVVQTQGKKHWRVYQPPDVFLKKTDPMERGKGKDKLSLDELGDPVVDTILKEGDCLYVPTGWPHTTDTIHIGEEVAAEPSVHLTIGVDTTIWGLSYASAREYCLARAGIQDSFNPLFLKVTSSDQYWNLQDALPFGFLENFEGDLSSILLQRMKDLEPTVDYSKLDTTAVIDRLKQHHRKMISIFANMYADVAYELTDVPMNVAFLRSKPYFNHLETAMADLVSWGKPIVKPSGMGNKSSSGGGFASFKNKQRKRRRK